MLSKRGNKSADTLPLAVFFDTDNTLYEYEPANIVAEKQALQKASELLNFPLPQIKELYSTARKQIKEQLGDTASSHSRLLYFQRLIELLGMKAHLLIALDLEQTFWRTFLANAPLFLDVYEFLADLHSVGIQTAIVTDLTSHVQLRKLTYFHLHDTFDAVVTSEEVGADKPDPRNFLLALRKLSLPSDAAPIWMIGDSSSTDIAGGNQINAVTFQKVHDGVKVGVGEELPDYTFTDFIDLRRLLQRLI